VAHAFFHSDLIWSAHPALVPCAWVVGGVTPRLDVSAQVEAQQSIARARLAESPEGEFPEIQAWRRVFSSMGQKPTQVRCAAESLLRRFRKEDALPPLHPLVDLCNAHSMAFATPIAVFDLAHIAGSLEVRFADGSESHEDFAGVHEPPGAGEIVFADAHSHAHARRWCHRQSARSAVSGETRQVLIVAEAIHASAGADIARLKDVLSRALGDVGCAVEACSLLSRAEPRIALPEWPATPG
jgi:DNA/RNA-binding domain of Phe-tRNA-synthetase-like protein